MFKLSPITKEQWVSVVKNSVLAGVAAFVATWVVTADPFSKAGVFAAVSAAGMAVFKTVEKAFTQG